MASLANTFQSLIRDDGNPDIIRRRAELEKLISVLLPFEIRLLQHGLKDMTFIRDFIPDLPVEIRIGITAFLDLTDLVTVRGVCKRWYECWTHISICNKLMKEYFRSAFENAYMHLSDLEKQFTFTEASDRLNAMRNGDYKSMTILKYDRDKNQDGEPAPTLDRRYRNGRVGWSIEGGIKISDLCNGAVSTYMLPDREKVHFWELSESILVAGTADKAKLYAWPLESGEINSVRLPSLPSTKLSIVGNRVGIATSKEVLIWTVGGPLTQMRIQEPTTQRKGFRELAILLHPDSIETIFIVLLTYQKLDEDSKVTEFVQWRVQKYFKGDLVKTFKLVYPLEGLHYQSGDDPAEVFWLSPRRIDDSGVYSIGSVPLDPSTRPLDLGCYHHWDRWPSRRVHRHLAHYINFDVYEEHLWTSFYHLPGGQKDVDDINFITPQVGDRPLKENSHLWSGQIFLPVIKVLDSLACRDPQYKFTMKNTLLMAIKSCDQISGIPMKARCVGGYDSTRTVWSIEERLSPHLGLVYCLVGGKIPAQQHSSWNASTADSEEHNTGSEIQGDGTFVVLFGDYEYVVWCYDKQLRVHMQI